MPTDFEIIEQLEKAIGRKLEHLEKIDVHSFTSGYTIDDNKIPKTDVVSKGMLRVNNGHFIIKINKIPHIHITT